MKLKPIRRIRKTLSGKTHGDPLSKMQKAVIISILLFFVNFLFASILITNYHYLADDPIRCGIFRSFCTVSFLESFLASYWEDILFFGFVGLVTLILFSSDPRTEKLINRITYLYTGRHVDSQAIIFAERQVQKLGLYGAQGLLEVELQYYSDTLNAYRISVRFLQTIANMFQNEDCEIDFKFIVYPDDVSPKDGIYGEITEAYVGHALDLGKSMIAAISGSKIITAVAPPFTRTLRCVIPRNTCVEYRYAFWQWAKVGEDFRLGTQRFVRNLRIVVQNKCENKFAVPLKVRFIQGDLEWRPREPDTRLYKDMPHAILAPEIEPGQYIVLNISAPIEG